MKQKRIQTAVAKFFIDDLEGFLGTKVSFSSVHVSFFHNVTIKDLLVYDQHNDTLLASHTAEVDFGKYDEEKNLFVLDRIDLQGARVKLIDYPDQINLQFVIDTIAEKGGGDGPPMLIKFNDLNLRDGIFTYHNHTKYKQDHGINFSDVHCKRFQLLTSGFTIYDGVVDFHIDELSFIERSGFHLRKLFTHMWIASTYMNFKDLSVETNNSWLLADKVDFTCEGLGDFARFSKKVDIDAKLKSSFLTYGDISYFIPEFRKYKSDLEFNGEFKGILRNIKAKSFGLRLGEHTHIKGRGRLDGLPYIDETFMLLDVTKLDSRVSDVQQFIDANTDNNTFQLASVLNGVDSLSYKGNFTGFLTDFVAYGDFNTNLGSVFTDLAIRPDSIHKFLFKGKLQSNGFELGKYLNLPKTFGQMSPNISVNGHLGTDEKVSVFIDGQVESLEFNKYAYSNIDLTGEFTSDLFDGSLQINDPNLDLQFIGKFNFADSLPEYDFTAYVPKANLYPLHFDKNDTSSYANFLMVTNFVGDEVDNLNGWVDIIDTKIARRDDSLMVDKFHIQTQTKDSTKSLSLKSDLLDISVEGNYNYKQMLESIKDISYKLLPDVYSYYKPNYEAQKNYLDTVNRFSLNIDLKKAIDFCKVFLPDYRIADSTKLHADYIGRTKELNLETKIDKFRYKDSRLDGITYQLRTKDSCLNSELKIDHARTRINKYFLKNIELKNYLSNNTIETDLSWNNSDTVNYQGQLSFGTHFHTDKPEQLSATLNIAPSFITLRNERWDMDTCKMEIDSSLYFISPFRLINSDQELSFSGIAGKSLYDSVQFEFNNLKLNNLDLLFIDNNIRFKGGLNGKGTVVSAFKNAQLVANLFVDSLNFNEQPIGYTQINSEWVRGAKKIHFKCTSDQGSTRTVNILGDYYVDNNGLDFKARLNQLNLGMFRPFVSSIFNDIDGTYSGHVHLGGNTSIPVLKGRLNMDNAKFGVDYLKTSYTSTARVHIIDNRFIFEETKVFDEHGNHGFVEGNINYVPDDDIYMDVTVKTNKLQVLNTHEKDNSMFYGNAQASGAMRFLGPSSNLSMELNGTPLQGARIFIPLNTSSDLTQSDFINFINHEVETVDEFSIEDYKVDLSGYNVNMSLNVTPDLEAQLIFDSKIGDVMKGKGNGNVNIEINKLGDFKMYGDYVIESGEYLFTLQNVINKKFKVRQGSSISWTGDPYNARTNVTADYGLKASLKNLLMDTSAVYQKRIPVNCELFMTGNLSQPEIDFGIDIPTADEETRQRVQSVLHSEEVLNRQILSLMVLNSFYANTDLNPDASNNQSNTVGVTTSELLSNQLSHWLSQMSNDFDIGVNYQKNYELDKDEIEVALSTQLWNDRISLNGNVGVRGQTQDNNDLVGEFSMDVKIDSKGKFRMKAFNRANDKYQFEDTPYTQGIGVFYRENFNTLGDLWRRYFKRKNSKQADSDSLVVPEK